MTTDTRKILKHVNQAMYFASIAMLIASMVLSLAVKPAAAQSTTGAMWTTNGSCGDPQNINAYAVGDWVYINYSGIDPATYAWQIQQQDGNPKPIVASGDHTVTSTAQSCFQAHQITAAEANHEYSVDMGAGHNDNYSVCRVGQIVVGKQCVTPDFTITKSLDHSYDPWYPTRAGQVLHYTVLVTNTGDVDLTNVTVADPGANELSCPATTLAKGASMTCIAKHWTTQADFNLGSYTNTATANSDQVGPKSSTVTVNLPQNPAIDVTKTQTSAGPYTLGQTITYSIGVTNTGNVTLNNVTVTDSTAIVGACSPVNGSSLAPAGVMTCAASHVVTQADVDAGTYINTATGTSGSLSDSASVTVTFAQNPALTIDKSVVTPPPYSVGGPVTYSIVVTNTGNITLHNVTVADPGVVMGVCSPTSGSALAPGAVMTCPATHVITQAQFDTGSYTNTATADSNETSPQTDSATINFIAGPALAIDKKLSNTGPFLLNDVIHFTIEVTNTGNVTLGAVTVTDPNAALGTCTPVNGSSLAPAAVMSCPATHTVTQVDIDAHSYTNTATAASVRPAAGPVSDSVTVDFIPAPALTIDKVATPGTYGLGDTIPYTITATNTGNVTLHNVTINDPSAVIDSCSPVLGSSLAPGASMDCSAAHVVTQPNMDAGSYVNTSTANSTEAGPESDTETVTFVQSPNLSIVKSVTSEGPYILGDTLTYSIVLTNTGNITLHNVNVTDLFADMGSCIPTVPAASLAPLGTITCSASHVVAQADMDLGSYLNTARGTSDETTPKEDSETVAFTQGPALTFEKKEVSQGPYLLGDTISYAFELTNIGNVTLHNVTITDPGAVTDSCTPALPVASLAPLAKVTCAASHAVTAADIAAGLTYMNTAVGDSTETAPKSSTVTVILGIKGCMDPKAENYNPKATISDGSCRYPENPTPTPVPTLPIPATGGPVLIPVTGADLGNTLPQASLPRNLFMGGLSGFGLAMVLSGLRRKFHL